MTTQQQYVRLDEERGGPNRRRYFDPRDGKWTGGLQTDASHERFYTQVKGFMLNPPGKPETWAYYVNPKLRDNINPDPVERAKDRARAVDGPFPTGAKETICRCAKNCTTWEEHYGKLGLVFMQWVNVREGEKRSLTEADIQAVLERLQEEGFRLVKEDAPVSAIEQETEALFSPPEDEQGKTTIGQAMVSQVAHEQPQQEATAAPLYESPNPKPTKSKAKKRKARANTSAK